MREHLLTDCDLSVRALGTYLIASLLVALKLKKRLNKYIEWGGTLTSLSISSLEELW